MDNLPNKAQLGDPVNFRVNESQFFSAHVQGIRFNKDHEILYDLNIYPIPEKWADFHLRLTDIPGAFVEKV